MVRLCFDKSQHSRFLYAKVGGLKGGKLNNDFKIEKGEEGGG